MLGMFLVVVVGIARDECKEGAAFWPGKAIGIVQIFFRKDLEECLDLSQKLLISSIEVFLHLMQRAILVLLKDAPVDSVVIFVWHV